MGRQPGFFDVEERLRDLSAKGDGLERIAVLVDFALFRAELEQAVPRADGAKGGRPAFNHVLMFKILLLAAMHGLSDERCEYLIKDRLSFMRFLGLGLAAPVPDANTIWAFREALKRTGAVERLLAQFDATLRAAGYLAMGGQIVDATIVAAPKQRNTEAERAAIKAGQIPEGWTERPAKLRQKDCDARWTVKFSKARPREDGAPQVDLAVPAFGYKNHVAIDRRHGLIRGWTASHAAAHGVGDVPHCLGIFAPLLLRELAELLRFGRDGGTHASFSPCWCARAPPPAEVTSCRNWSISASKAEGRPRARRRTRSAATRAAA